jgi:glycine/D-amino acid oxidase-like deaminating enzyme
VPETADVIVVGGGIEGLSTAYALTQAGVSDVLVLERAALASGGTGKSSGVVRCHYGVPSLAAMAWKGLQLFENAIDVLGTEIGFEQIGYVVGVGEGNLASLEANVAMHRSLGIDSRTVGAADVTGLWPYADVSDLAGFAYEPRGGYGDATRTALAFAAAARRGGARIRQGAAVAEVCAAAEVRLTSGERVTAGAVVVATGVWSRNLLQPLGIDVPVRAQREAILLVEAGAGGPSAEEVRDLPVLSDLGELQYVRPERSGQLLVGNSDHSAPEWANPDSYVNRASDDFVESALAKVAHRFPGLGDVRLAGSYAGCYDVTPDYNPVISETGIPGLFVCAGFSGHGFKISPAVGVLTADLVLHGASRDPQVPEGDFTLTRFAEGRLLTSAHAYAGAGQMR